MTDQPTSASSDARAGARLTVVAAAVPRERGEALADWLAEAEVAASIWEDWEGGPSRVEVFLAEAADPEAAVAALRGAGRACGLDLDPVIGFLREEDWTETWKRFFHTEKISPRLVVRPPWEGYAPTGEERVIVMDPGMSFGTGRHGTTQACLRMIDELAQGDLTRRVLDIGCGSGILSIAAAKLGFGEVQGYDNDPDAVRIAAANAAANGVCVRYSTGDLSVTPMHGELVVANVLAAVLNEHAQAVAAAVREVAGHALLLSGILDSQYAAVVSTYGRRGFREVKNLLVGEWRSGWFERP